MKIIRTIRAWVYSLRSNYAEHRTIERRLDSLTNDDFLERVNKGKLA